MNKHFYYLILSTVVIVFETDDTYKYFSHKNYTTINCFSKKREYKL